jgi:ABC-2 type transport system permease protein
MIGTILRISWINLKRDRTALFLTFLLPVAFFSIFAVIFGGMSGGTSKVEVAIADLDGSEASRILVAALRQETGLRVTTTGDGEPGAAGSPAEIPLTRESALAIVQSGDMPVALVIPRGYGENFGKSAFGGGDGAAAEGTIELLADKSDPVASNMVAGLLQKAGMTASPDLLAQNGLSIFEKYGGAFTPQQQAAVGQMTDSLRRRAQQPPAEAAGSSEGEAASGGFSGGIVPVKVVDVLGETKRSGLIAFYAAGTGVMFLLFSMSGASGSLLDDQESGALERLLTSRIGMTRLLFGKWVFISLLGCAQLLVMFVWGAVVFGLELREHLAGFAIMTIATAGAAAALGLVLATASRTRAQQSGMATILILMMSALGGSMFPRFLMPEIVQKIGLFTFNAWALDGFQKVFWYEQPLSSLVPQVAVLVCLAAVFFFVARRLAARWETS